MRCLRAANFAANDRFVVLQTLIEIVVFGIETWWRYTSMSPLSSKK
jgi:hypothetical protein